MDSRSVRIMKWRLVPGVAQLLAENLLDENVMGIESIRKKIEKHKIFFQRRSAQFVTDHFRGPRARYKSEPTANAIDNIPGPLLY